VEVKQKEGIWSDEKGRENKRKQEKREERGEG